MRDDVQLVSDISVLATGAVFAAGLVVLAFRLAQVQLVDSAKYSYDGARQSVRRVQTAGPRGRILARDGTVLADNRASVSIVARAEAFQRRTRAESVEAVSNAAASVAAAIGVPCTLSTNAVATHFRLRLARPLVVWRDVGDEAIARFSEREREFPGFECVETEERTYPEGRLAAHVVGYVGRGETESPAGERFNFRDKEMRGRSGVESFYDGFLRGSPGEKRVVVDARGFAVGEETLVEARRGPDLRLSIDVRIQRAAERQLRGECAACAVIDPRDGAVLALASAPGFDPNEFVPTLPEATYARYREHSLKPLLNRAAGGAYAPGSTFKTVTALAGLRASFPPDREYECIGVFELGGMRLHCARRWGHGPLDMRHALRESCNPYFCNLGCMVGTNALIRAAHDLGLGAKTGLDLGVDMAGAVPDGEWKMRMYGERWYPGDVAQMSIGQGMLLVSPLQMARVAGAIGTGFLVRPRLRADAPVERVRVPFRDDQLAVVREGMRMVVDGGTGRLGGEGVPVAVAGKTGTAEVGRGAKRRKNTWFICFAPAKDPTVALAIVVENGASGGGTSAPKAAEILKAVFGG